MSYRSWEREHELELDKSPFNLAGPNDDEKEPTPEEEKVPNEFEDLSDGEEVEDDDNGDDEEDLDSIINPKDDN